MWRRGCKVALEFSGLTVFEWLTKKNTVSIFEGLDRKYPYLVRAELQIVVEGVLCSRY